MISNSAISQHLAPGKAAWLLARGRVGIQKCIRANKTTDAFGNVVGSALGQAIGGALRPSAGVFAGEKLPNFGQGGDSGNSSLFAGARLNSFNGDSNDPSSNYDADNGNSNSVGGGGGRISSGGAINGAPVGHTALSNPNSNEPTIYAPGYNGSQPLGISTIDGGQRYHYINGYLDDYGSQGTNFFDQPLRTTVKLRGGIFNELENRANDFTAVGPDDTERAGIVDYLKRRSDAIANKDIRSIRAAFNSDIEAFQQGDQRNHARILEYGRILNPDSYGAKAPELGRVLIESGLIVAGGVAAIPAGAYAAGLASTYGVLAAGAAAGFGGDLAIQGVDNLAYGISGGSYGRFGINGGELFTATILGGGFAKVGQYGGVLADKALGRVTGQVFINDTASIAAEGALGARPTPTNLGELAEPGNVIPDLLYGARTGEGLPGSNGVLIPKRPTVPELENLTAKHGVEFATIYERGTNANGGGGQYYLYSGTDRALSIPLDPNLILINHTHPRGSAFASEADYNVLEVLKLLGSPQRSSQIIPVGKAPVRFGIDK